MIQGIPNNFDIDCLSKFSFGEAEGQEDSMLKECLCEIAPIKEFLLGKKDIVLGEKGAGKTALYRMLTDRSLTFVSPPNKSYQILALDESIEYKQLKSIIDERIHSSVTDNKSVKYQFIWELFITYKILAFVTDDLHLEDEFLQQQRSEISSALGFEKPKVGIMQFLLSHKKTIGIKLDQLHPTTSNFYISAEPVEAEKVNESIFKIDLKEIKKKISSLLDKNNMALYVLLDRLDEFVIKEDYEVQKKLLEGLMACYRNFSSTSQIRIKPFFRTDIFNRLDLSGLGTDKILDKCLHLKWEPRELRELIARRIVHNIYEHCNVESLSFETDLGKLYLDTKYVEDQNSKHKNTTRNFFSKWCLRKWDSLIEQVMIALHELNRRERKTNFNDAITVDVIHLLFPKQCEHITLSGKKEFIKFIDFIDTHLLFSTNHSTPRVVIAFFEQCLLETRAYFGKNRDITSLPKNNENEFELVKIECI